MPRADERHIEVIARGLVLDGSRVLLCQNRKRGYYYLPGGHVEFGETAAHALAREIAEETGLTARVGPPLLAYEQTFEPKPGVPAHEIGIVFHVERLADPTGEPTTEVASTEPKIAFEWVELAAVAELDIRPERHKAWLAAGGASDGTAVAWASDAPTPT